MVHLLSDDLLHSFPFYPMAFASNSREKQNCTWGGHFLHIGSLILTATPFQFGKYIRKSVFQNVGIHDGRIGLYGGARNTFRENYEDTEK